MARPHALAAPRIDPLRLPDLIDGYESEIEAGANLEALRFEGVDIAGLDLTGITLSECALRDVQAHEASLRGASILDTRIERLNAPVLGAARSRMREVEIVGSRFGSVEFFETNWQSVRISGCKIGYLNLRAATLRDVLIEDCQIDELDLGGARLDRVALTNTTVGRLEVNGSRNVDVDLRDATLRGFGALEGLRGITLSSYQIADLAPLFAEQFGIRIEG